MRLPGTFNLGGRNHLPTAEFLLHYEELKRAKQKAKLEAEANNGTKAEFGDKPLPKTFAAGKKGGADAKKDEKSSDTVLTPDGETFSPLQDNMLIKMKIEGKTWNQISTDLVKEVDAIKHRFKEIKPEDWEAQAAEWKMNNSGGGDGGGGKKHKGNRNNENNQNQQQGGKGNNNNNNNHNQQHEGKKQNNHNNKNQSKKQEEAQAEAGADNDAASDAGTWAFADENFTEKEVNVLEKIVEIELRNAFVRIAKSFAAHKDGKRIHPDSIAQKVLGEGLDLSSLGG